MAPEGGAVATTMVAGQEIGGLALVERVGLAVFHDAADVEVRPVDGIQIMVVSATVRELVRVTKTHVEHLRMLLLQGFEGHAEGDAVQPFAIPEAAVRNAGVHILHHPGRPGVRVGGFMATAARETAAVVVHGKTDALPGGVHHDLAFVAGILVHDLHHAHVRVGNRVVGVDPLVVRPAAEHFAVARIGEVHRIVHLHPAVLGPVAQQVAMPGGIAP